MDDSDSDEPRCPVCNRPVSSMAVVGPDEAVVAPCGHRVSPRDVDGGDDSS